MLASFANDEPECFPDRFPGCLLGRLLGGCLLLGVGMRFMEVLRDWPGSRFAITM